MIVVSWMNKVIVETNQEKKYCVNKTLPTVLASLAVCCRYLSADKVVFELWWWWLARSWWR